MKNLLGFILAFLVQSSANAYFIDSGATNIGTVDDILSSAYLSNSGNAESAWINQELTNLGVNISNVSFTKDENLNNDWTLADGQSDIYAYELDANIDYFILKLGNIFSPFGPGNSNESNTFLFENLLSDDFATIDLSLLVTEACSKINDVYKMSCNNTVIDVEKISHITLVYNSPTTSTVPEPSIIALLGLGLFGLGLMRRRIK